MQVLFGLPSTEEVVHEVPCWLAPHRVAGTAFLTTRHLAFSTLSAAPTARGAPATAVTLCHPLARITFMTRSFVGSSAALSLTLFDKTLVMLYKFPGGKAAREGLFRAVLTHVAGTNSTLDRQLRGATSATAAKWCRAAEWL